jgi:uncharacterized membrane protein HdeD (DUF308 family)
MIKRLKSLAVKTGYRGTYLALIGLFDIFFGLFYLTSPDAHLPIGHIETIWGWVFIGVGTFLIMTIFWSKDRWPFAISVFFKLFWGLLLLVGPHFWFRGLIWITLSIITFVVSSWPEPCKVIHEDPPEIGGS